MESQKYVGKDGYLIHPTGIKYAPTYGPGPKSGSKMECFGHLMNKPNITSVADMDEAIAKMDEVEMRKVWIADEHGKPVESENFLGITSKQTGQTYAVGTDRYIPTQDKAFFKPLADTMRERKLSIGGEIVGQGTGRTKALLVAHNPDFVIQLLNEYDDTIMLGVMVSNSYDRLSKGEISLLNLRMVCCNFGLWGDVFKRLTFKHVASYDELLRQYGHYLEQAVDASEILRNAVHVAEQTVLTFKEAEHLLWGLKMPILDIEEIIANPGAFMPEWKGLKATTKPKTLNAYELNTMTNAMITYRPYGKDAKPVRSVELLQAAAKILTPKLHDKLIAKGAEEKKAYEKAVARREREKEKAIAMKVRSVA